MRLPLVSCSLVLVMAGCPGDDSSSSDDAAATTSGSGSSTVGASTGDSATSQDPTSDDVTGDITGDPSSDDGTASCPPFTDEASPSPITVAVVNNTAEGVWLPMDANCFESVPYLLTDPRGAAVNWRGPACGTCEGAAQGDCPCPPPFCDEVTALYLEPSGQAHYTWAGLAYLTETLPAACPGINECGASCERAVVPAPGGYTFTVQAGRASGCAVEPCECTPSEGSCTLYDPSMMFSDLTEHTATLTLPGESWVVIEIL